MYVWTDRSGKEYFMSDLSTDRLYNIAKCIEEGRGHIKYVNRTNLNRMYDELYTRGAITYLTYMKCRIFRRKLKGRIK